MGGRARLGCHAFVFLAAISAAACSDKGGKDQRTEDKGGKDKGGPGLDARCEQLAKGCGDPAKADQLVAECKAAAAKQTQKGCVDQAIAAYACFEKKLCGKADKVWALDDFRVLAHRNDACVTEHDALETCVGK